MTEPCKPPDFARDAAIRHRITVRGTVQGVGFRPFVFREAVAHGLSGWVCNSGEGVEIEAEGPDAAVASLMEVIREQPPTNARVTSVTARTVAPEGRAGFTVRPSHGGSSGAEILPDLATCEECLTELLDPADRRHLYPFINCTQCGPRYSIIEALPYDRARTAMRHFTMCPACQAEYDDPESRRFHAEPNTCPQCGPRLTLLDGSGASLAEADEALTRAAAAVREGQIVALKGIGGFHFIADAANDEAVRRLRQRKHRAEKPFAVMFPTLRDLRAACRVGPSAEALLSGPERPIVLLARTGAFVAPAVAPDTPRLGAMLPYAPLHHLLLRALGAAVVATSGNVTDEPIITDDHDALRRLAGIADLFLVHDRPILRAVDDSVVQIVCGRPQLLRRARGYAPAPVAVEGLAEGILAFGGHLKASVALTNGSGIVLSQHLGDLDTAAARAGHAKALEEITRLHGALPRIAACDLHPDYAASRAAERSGLPVSAVQHHVAHAAACLAEHDLSPPALGVIWDGTGYGPDGTIWGGEFLVLKPDGWRRAAHLRPFRLPGGEAAMRETRRAALGLLFEAFGADCFAMHGLPPLADFDPATLPLLRQMLLRGVNAPLTSSIGRLFDAVASLIGLRQRSSYEGQAAMALEWAASSSGEDRPYAFPLREAGADQSLVLDWQPALVAVIADRDAGVPAGGISASFHEGLAQAIVETATRVGHHRVALSGGCFQNTRLTELTVAALKAAGFEPLWHRRVPPNDGGLAFGQAAWASWTRNSGEPSCA